LQVNIARPFKLRREEQIQNPQIIVQVASTPNSLHANYVMTIPLHQKKKEKKRLHPRPLLL